MPQLNPTWYASQLFWLVICFFVLYYIMSRFITPRIADIFAKRQSKIDEYIERATETKRQAEEALQKYHTALNEATKKANEALEKTKKELDEEITAKQNALSVKLRKKVEEGENKIQQSKIDAMVKVYDISEILAKDIVTRLGLSKIANENFKSAIKKTAKD